jgi:hypothetical protein
MIPFFLEKMKESDIELIKYLKRYGSTGSKTHMSLVDNRMYWNVCLKEAQDKILKGLEPLEKNTLWERIMMWGLK